MARRLGGVYVWPRQVAPRFAILGQQMSRTASTSLIVADPVRTGIVGALTVSKQAKAASALLPLTAQEVDFLRRSKKEIAKAIRAVVTIEAHRQSDCR